LASIYTEASGKLVLTADPTNAQASSALEFNVDGSNAMFINSSQQVGIGTVSPSELLHVAGNFKLSDGADRSIKGPANANLVISNNASSSAQGIKFSTDGGTTTDVFIQDGGNVGIGTTSPSQKLHIDGSARITGAIYDSNNAAGTSGQVLSSTGTGTDWVSLSEISGVDGTGTANYISKWSDTDTITNSQIQDDGTTVGIGQAPSTAKLTVSGDIQTAAPETTTASAWKLGNVGLGGVFVGAADYVTVSVGGLVVKLPIAIFPETQDYYDRVIADGGTFEGLLGYESAVTILKAE